MLELFKSLVVIALFALPVALIGLAVVCFGRCVSDMLDDREFETPSPERQLVP